MIPLRDILEAKDLPELQQMLVEKHMSYHHREKKETLVNRLLEVTMTAQPDVKQPETKQRSAPPPAAMLTPDQVMEKLQAHKNAGLLIMFTDNDRTWHFKRKCGVTRYKNKDGFITEKDIVKEDSGTMTQPLEIIVRCADALVRGGALSDVA